MFQRLAVIVLGLIAYGSCGELGGVDHGHAFAGGLGSFGYEAALPLGIGHGLGYGAPYPHPHALGYGYGHGHGLGLGGHYNRPAALYDNYNAWKPIIKKPIIKKPVHVKPYIAPVYKPIVPLYKPSHFTVTPSLSYGFSYKLIPTGGYGPDFGHGVVDPGYGHGHGLGHGFHK